MVFLTNCLLRWRLYRYKPFRPKAKQDGQHFFKKQKYLRISSFYHGRIRNCYGLAKRRVMRQLAQITHGRQTQSLYMVQLAKDRVQGALHDYGMNLKEFILGLNIKNIMLNYKSLSQLAIYEPKTFQGLVKLSQKTVSDKGLKNALWNTPDGVYINK